MQRKGKFKWRRTATALLSGTALSSLLAGVLATAASASGTWTTSQLVPPGGAARNIAAVSLPPLAAEEVFWVPQNGSVQEKTYAGGWSATRQIAAAGSADPYSDIVAVYRDRTSVSPASIVDVFWVTPGGAVDHMFNAGGTSTFWTWAPQVAPAGSATTSASVAVVSRASNTWELWWVEPNGGVEDAYQYDGGPSGRFQLAAPSGSTPLFEPRQITVVSRAPNTMELWWVGADGSVQDRYYYDGSGWNGFTLAPSGSADAQLGSGPAITAVSRASNTMEVWFVGHDNSVQDRYYYDGYGWNGFTLSPANSAYNAMASVAPSASAMNVTWTGSGSNSVQDASFPPWSQIQLAPGGPFNDGGIAAVTRSPGTADVFWVTYNGAIEHASQ